MVRTLVSHRGVQCDLIETRFVDGRSRINGERRSQFACASQKAGTLPAKSDAVQASSDFELIECQQGTVREAVQGQAAAEVPKKHEERVIEKDEGDIGVRQKPQGIGEVVYGYGAVAERCQQPRQHEIVVPRDDAS